jgi:hypothetical protein
MVPRTRAQSDPQAENIMSALRRQYQEPQKKGFSLSAVLLALIIGYLATQAYQHRNERTVPNPESVVRALATPAPAASPVVPRAELVGHPFAPRPIGDSLQLQMPDGQTVRTTVRLAVARYADLPVSGNQLGDMRYTRDGAQWYVWTRSIGATAPTWIDP